jgi:hypothetical protein
MESLDDSWVTEFKELDKDYAQFYKEKVQSIDLIFLYVNANREVVVAKKRPFILDLNARVDKSNLLKIIHSSEICEGVSYRLASLAKFNFTIEPDEVISLDTIDGEDYFHAQKYIGDIYFSDTITLFQDVNALFLIFNEKNSHTRLTKCVRFHKPSRRTRRKRVLKSSTHTTHQTHE